MCVASWSGWGQNRPVQTPPLPLTFCGERFATPHTLTFAVILPLYSLRHCLIVSREDISRSNVTSSNKTFFILSKVCLSHPLRSLDFHDYPQKMKIAEKSQNQQKFQCSRRPTASSRQNSANQQRVFEIIFTCIVGKRTDFSRSNSKHKQLAIEDQFDESCLRSESGLSSV